MKNIKWLSKILIILSIVLFATGVWEIINTKEYLLGFGCILMAFGMSVNDWIKLFKKHKQKNI